MLNLNEVYYFLQFIQEGSLLKASEKLHISQPSLSRAMQNLERELNLNLFDRTGNKINLNQNGIELKPYFENLILMEKSIKTLSSNLRNKNCLITIGLTAPGPLYVINKKFNKRKHQLQIEYLKEEEIIERVKLGILDIGFINNEINDNKLVSRKFIDEQLYVYLPINHFLSKKKEGVTFDEIDGQSFLLGKEIGIWENIVKDNLPNSKFYFQEMDYLTDVVSSSSLPSFITNVTYNIKTSNNRIAIPIVDKQAKITFYMIVLKDEEEAIRKCISL